MDGFGPSIRKVQQGIETMDDSFAITRPDDISLVLQQIYKCRKEIIRACRASPCRAPARASRSRC